MRLPVLLLLSALCWATACQKPPQADPAAAYAIEPGFALSLVARDPLVVAPVALGFDARGRPWVLELQSYMHSIEGTEEDAPISRIVILEDEDGDGRADRSRVFLDSLVAPRALALVYGGLLYAEPPNLWFVEIDENDQPGTRTLVDSTYTDAGNIEHQPNGLLLAMDNWIYSAKSNLRYRRVDGQWQRDFTALRGQWGIAQDDHGRLYYNNNSTLLMGDQVLPQAALLNLYQRPRHSINQVLTDSQRVYPAHATLMNRGYQDGVLDSTGRLVNTSSACGPLVYRGGSFPAAYQGDAFVAVPEGNLVKRLDLQRVQGRTRARHVDQEREFLRSNDPLFRPVNLYQGPDEALYIVDMHRGVIQHQAYMTGYLREKILAQGFDTVIDQGRIWKVQAEGRGGEGHPDFAQASAPALVAALHHPNGWVRDQAQHHLVYRQMRAAVPLLRELVGEGTAPAALHALWALEGLDALAPATWAAALRHEDPAVVQQALYQVALAGQPQDLPWAQVLARQDPEIDRYLALALPQLIADPAARRAQLRQLAQRRKGDPIWGELALSGARNGEADERWLQESCAAQARAVAEARAARRPNPMLAAAQHQVDNRTQGLRLFRQYCSNCHGLDGRGQQGLAPSLVDAPHIAGPVEKLGLVLLYGLRGPLHREGQVYQFAAQMPGLAQNQALSNRDIAHIMAYVRNAFSTAPAWVDAQTIDSLRHIDWPAGKGFTEADLQALMTRHEQDP